MTTPKYTAYDRRVGVDPVKKVRLTPDGELEEVIGYHFGTIRTFLARISPRGCHLCFSHKPDDFGYMHVRIGGRYGKNEPAHRAVYRLLKGDIPDGMVVRHTCDQPSCLNPDHLILGTHAQNVADMVARNRNARGVDNGRAKLTPEQVDYIYRHPEESHAILARRFNVDPTTIKDVRSGKNWKLYRSDGMDPMAGYRNRNAKLSAVDIPEIRRLAAEGVSRRKIGRMFGVHNRTITKIVNGEYWKHVT